MAVKKKGNRPQMIHCEFCGEDYADSYRSCPFCDERISDSDDDYDYENVEEEVSRGGGKRLANNRRGGGYGGAPSPFKIIGTVVSLALIVAAVIIVITIVKPLIDKGKTTLPEGSPNPVVSTTPDLTPEPADTTSPAPTDTVAPTEEPALTPAPTPAVTPAPTPSVPAGQTATSFTLDKSDFSMSDKYGDPVRLKVTFVPAGTTGTITWTSSNPEVATVDANGKITHGTKNGQATITATMGAVTQTCVVRCSFTGAATSTGGAASGGTATNPPAISGLSLNKSDFTFTGKDNPSVQMKVNGTSSTPVWSIGDSSVATISGTGVVKPVGRGQTTITCTVDGQTLKCIVRCNF